MSEKKYKLTDECITTKENKEYYETETLYQE